MWTGPGTILTVEGAILWINMMGELWRVSAEQTRHAAYEERMGAEVVAESFEEMRERLKRNPNRPGYRDVTREVGEDDEERGDGDAHGAEAPAEDDVLREGDERGRPRA